MAAFTNNFLRGLKPAERSYEERDGGCPGLLIRVSQRGRKVFEVMVSEGGKRRRVRLGTFPELSLAMARRRAAEAKTAPHLLSTGMTVRDLWQDYSQERSASLRSWSDVQSVWNAWVELAIGGVRVEDINLQHGAKKIENVARRSSPNHARKVITTI